MAISPQQLTIYLYSAHCAVIFAIAQLSYCFILELANIKMFNLQTKLTHFPVPLSFCKIPHNLIIYWQNTVSYSTVKLVHSTVAWSSLEKNMPYEHYLWLYQLIIISRHYSSPEIQHSQKAYMPTLKLSAPKTVCLWVVIFCPEIHQISPAAI